MWRGGSLALATIAVFVWLQFAARPWLAIAILAACTALAALDPDLCPLRADAERVMKQVRPTEVAITKLQAMLGSPVAATDDLIVPVTGNGIDRGSPGTTMAGLRVSMAKRGGKWLVTDAEVQEPVRAGR